MPAAQILSVSVKLPASSIVNPGSIPLLPAPGAGLLYFVLGILVTFKFGTIAYQDGTLGGNVQAKVGTFLYSSNVGIPSVNIYSLQFASTFTAVIGNGVQTIDPTALDNQPMMLEMPGANGASLISASLGNSGGSGYSPGDTGVIQNPQHTGFAGYIVDTVDPGGVVTALHLDPTNTGTQYVANGTLSNQQTFVNTGGGDGNLTANTVAGPPGDGIMEVTFLYMIADATFSLSGLSNPQLTAELSKIVARETEI